MKTKLLSMLLLFAISATTHASLFSRGGGTMYYDDVLDVTWLQDANYANTDAYVTLTGNRDVTATNGRMNWDESVEWAGQLSFGGFDDWRLPDVKPVDGSTIFNTTFSNDGSTDVGYNITSPLSEMAYMYYVNLGNSGANDTSGVSTGCSPNCLTNVDPFSNLETFVYWSGVEFAPNLSNAWLFDTRDGFQSLITKDLQFYAWAVRSGDVTASAVPVPAAFWLFGSTLIGLVGLKRKR